MDLRSLSTLTRGHEAIFYLAFVFAAAVLDFDIGGMVDKPLTLAFLGGMVMGGNW